MKYLLFISLIMLAACETPVCCDPGPDTFFIAIFTEEGSDYLGQSSEEDIALYYFENSSKKLLDPQLVEIRDTTFLSEVNLPFVSNSVTKDFYLEVGDDVDTLFVDVAKNKYRSVRLNGKEGILSTNRNASPRFILTK